MKKDDTKNNEKFAVVDLSCLTCMEIFVCSTGNLDVGRYLSRIKESVTRTTSLSELELHQLGPHMD